MKKILYIFALLSVVLTACGGAVQSPTSAVTPTITDTPGPTATATATIQPTLAYPVEGYGPSNFPSDVDPLTGLQVANPALLDRRPMVIKVSNLPRDVRPQWGLSLTDIVFAYYTEAGSTRFAAIFYGNDASTVGPIRSGRFFDSYVVEGYKGVFVFGFAYYVEMDQFLSSSFANRLVIEGAGSPLSRYDPNGVNYLMAKTSDVSAYITNKGVQNGRQDLDGMSFKLAPPGSGQPGTQAIIRHSGSIYNRWDYDPATGKYLRFSDTLDDFDSQNEQYAQLTDRLTNQPITADNVVVLYVNHEVYSTDSNGVSIYNVQLVGNGKAIAFRDGQSYLVRWHRDPANVVSLTYDDGTPFPFKPGNTWFEVVGANSAVEQTGSNWRFTHIMP